MTCSRCGATDDRHTMKCLKAMAFGMAMGVEKRPVLVAAPVRVEDDAASLRAEIGQLSLTKRALDEAVAALERERVGASQLEDRVTELEGIVDSLGEKLIAAQAEVERERNEKEHLLDVVAEQRVRLDRHHQWPSDPPVTQLPPGYYDGRVTAARLAEIEEEVRLLNESPHLDVTIIDGQNAVVTPKADVLPDRDDDYTPAAIDATMREAIEAQAAATTTPPAPDTTPIAPVQEAQPVTADPDHWATLVKRVRQGHKLSQDQLARRLSVARSLVGQWEHGKCAPGAGAREQLRKMDAALGKKSESHVSRGVASHERMRELARTHFQPFLDERVERVEDTPDNFLSATELMNAYDQWRKTADDVHPPLPPHALGMLATELGIRRKQATKVYPERFGNVKPMLWYGLRWKQEAEAPAPEPEPEVDPREANRRAVEEIRALMRSETSRVEEVPSPGVEIPHGPDELTAKLAQLKHFGIGGPAGVSRDAARVAVEDLHPTGRDVWKRDGEGSWSDDELQATAYQLLVKCMDGLPEGIAFDYKDDVLATQGFVEEDVIAAVRKPQRVEIRPESWDKEKRYPILGFHRGDCMVVLGMRQPNTPRVIAAYWTSLLAADRHVVNRHGGGGAKKKVGLPSTPTATISRLTGMGAEIEGDPVLSKTVKVTYKGQDLGKISCGAVTKSVVESDYQRCLRKMQAIDRRQEAKAS
jgi:transcriptional regulator with XRE-family HTH domain